MNRVGLSIALILTVAFVVVFGLYPGLDLAIAAVFWDPPTRLFLWGANQLLDFLRSGDRKTYPIFCNLQPEPGPPHGASEPIGKATEFFPNLPA